MPMIHDLLIELRKINPWWIFLASKGMGDSKEFAGELFVALARRRNLEPEDGITKEQLKEFWEEMTDQNFDSRLRIFFDM